MHRLHLTIVTIILWSSVAVGQPFKVFDKYRHFFFEKDRDATIDLSDDKKKVDDSDAAIDLDGVDVKKDDSAVKSVDFDGIAARENSHVSRSSKNDRKLAYDNPHRNQIATLDPNQPLLPPTSTTLTTGLFHTCVIARRAGVEEECIGRSCGPVKCWGHDESGQSSPPPGAMFTQISAGGYFTCGIKTNGQTVCWGEIDKIHSQSRNRSDESKPKKEEIYPDERYKRRLDKSEYKDEIERRRSRAKDEYKISLFYPKGQHIQVSSGMKHACALSRDLTVHCWGRNDFGETAAPSTKFVQIASGNSFTCGLRDNGTVECWGRHHAGQTIPPENRRFRQISSSSFGDHVCGIAIDDSTVHCWGDNIRGQTEPQEGRFIQVTPGLRTTCGIRDSIDGAPIHCWGGRANDFLDRIKRDDNSSVGKHYQQVSLGKDHACAVSKVSNEDEASLTSLQCWWLGGSDFAAHKVPIGMEMAA